MLTFVAERRWEWVWARNEAIGSLEKPGYLKSHADSVMSNSHGRLVMAAAREHHSFIHIISFIIRHHLIPFRIHRPAQISVGQEFSKVGFVEGVEESRKNLPLYFSHWPLVH